MASCPSSAPSPVISLAKADLSAGFLTWGRCTTGSLKAGLTLIFPCEALSTRPEDPQQTFIYLPTYADCLPYLTHTLKAILAMLPLKRTPKLHTHTEGTRVAAYVTALALRLFARFLPAVLILSCLSKLAAETAHLHWTWVERGLRYSCSFQRLGPNAGNCLQTLVLVLRLERPWELSPSTSSLYR